MLLDFKMKNYKSFYDETTVSMIADSAKRDFPDRLIDISEKKSIKKKVLLDSLEVIGCDIESTLKYFQKKYPDTAPHSIDEITLEQFTPYIKALEKKKEAIERETKN